MGHTSALERLSDAALNLVFPPRCGVCGVGGALLCAGCEEALLPARPPRCARCWRPAAPSVCSACVTAPPVFDSLRAAFVYEGAARELVHALKYRGMSALARPMARLMADCARVEGQLVDAVVPVPLAGHRQRTRGYNQAEGLARGLGKELGVPVRPRALRRRKSGPPQARAADAEERRRNVEHAFVPRERLEGLRVLLVDDVTTTGATLNACARALREANARSVAALAFARED